jgi:hypothetical protein
MSHGSIVPAQRRTTPTEALAEDGGNGIRPHINAAMLPYGVLKTWHYFA